MRQLLFGILGWLICTAIGVILILVLPPLPDYAYVAIGFCAGFIGATAGQYVARKQRA